MEKQNRLYKSALITGIIVAGAGILIQLIEYLADIRPVGIMKPILMMIFTLTVNIVIIAVSLHRYRKSIGGYIKFGNAFVFCFIAFVTAAVIVAIFTYLFLLYDPQYIQNIMQEQKAWMENYLAGKVSDEKIAETLDKIDEQAANYGSITQQLKNFIFPVILGAIVSLIIAAIMKKNPGFIDAGNTGGVV